MKDFVKKIYCYNNWRHNLIYSKLENLSKDIIEKNEPGLYFRSIKGTFNHILLADILWYGRISGSNNFHFSDEKNKVIKLEDINKLWGDNNRDMFTNFFDDTNSEWLNSHRKRQTFMFSEYNKLLDKFMETNEETFNLQEIVYLDTEGIQTRKLLSDCLFHVVNHHSHHLGQITTVLTSHGESISFDYTMYNHTL